MTISEVHDYILFRLNKDQNGYSTHEEIDQALDRAQMTHFMRLYSNPKEYQAGQRLRSAAFDTQKIHDDLSPFKERWYINEEDYSATNTQGTGPNGDIVLPSDYLHLLAIHTYSGSWSSIYTANYTPAAGTFEQVLEKGKTYRIRMTLYTASSGDIGLTHEGADIVPLQTVSDLSPVYYFTAQTTGENFTYNFSVGVDIQIDEFNPSNLSESRVELIDENQWSGRISSTFLAPTTSEPIVRQVEGNGVVNEIIVTGRRLQMYPNTGYNGEILYLRRPAIPLYSYTISGEAVTHNAGASTDMEWSDSAMNEIMEEAIQLLSANHVDQMNIAFSQNKKSEGV